MNNINIDRFVEFAKTHKTAFAWWGAALLIIILALLSPNTLLMSPLGFIPFIAGIYRAVGYSWFPKNPLAVIGSGCIPVIILVVILAFLWPIVEFVRQSVYLFNEYRTFSSLSPAVDATDGVFDTE